MILGLTGQIGAGKTLAASFLAELGAVIIDADLIGRQVVEQSATLRKQLARAFGGDILDGRGHVRRQRLAALAFADQASRDCLNDLVHPHLLRALRSRVKRAIKTSKLIVIDAALLIHWGMQDEVDCVLVIHAGKITRLRRLKKRGVRPADTRARERAQLPFGALRAHADRVILNSGSARDLRRKIRAFATKIMPASD